MSDDRTEAEESLAELVKKLTDAVEMLSDRFRRKRISDAVLAAVVVVMLLFGTLYYFVELPDRRADTSNRIRDLACYAVRFRPPGYSPTSDALRRKYRCPPFDVKAAVSAGATDGPTAAASAAVPRTTPATPARRSSTPHRVTPTATVPASSGTSRPRPRSTVTRVRPAPPAATVTRTAPPDQPTTPAATGGLIGGVLCTVTQLLNGRCPT